MFFAYPVSGWLMFNYNKQIAIRQGYVYPILFITGIAFAAFTEYAQRTFTTYRSAEPLDFIADLLGITCGCIIMKLFEGTAIRLCDKLQQYMHNIIYR